MSRFDLPALVRDSNQTLVESGAFPEDWLSLYRSALNDLSNARGTSWPKDMFAAVHYASTHLGLRYLVWRSSVGASNVESESVLGLVQFESDCFLWKSVRDLPAWNSECEGNDPESSFLELCFGKASPVTHDLSLPAWSSMYNEHLRILHHSKGLERRWSKWFCLALHFASFYLELFQYRDIDLSEDPEIPGSPADIDALVESLRRSIENERVLKLIQLWLSSATLDRDASGLPVIGIVRPREERVISVRTSTEIFLQLCSQNSLSE